MSEPMLVISGGQLKLIEMYAKWSETHKKAFKEIRSRPLASALKAERERVLKEIEQTAQNNWEEIETDEGEIVRVVCVGDILCKIESLRRE